MTYAIQHKNKGTGRSKRAIVPAVAGIPGTGDPLLEFELELLYPGIDPFLVQVSLGFVINGKSAELVPPLRPGGFVVIALGGGKAHQGERGGR